MTDLIERMSDFDAHFTLTDKLGEGTFGQVYKVVSQNNATEVYALKILPQYELNPTMENFFQTEATVLQDHQLRYTIQSYGYFNIAIARIKYRGILLEYCPGYPLSEMRQRNPELLHSWNIEQTVLYLMKQVALGLVELHSYDLAHHDLKADNVLIRNLQIKLIDLGLVRKKDTVFPNNGFYGAPYLSSPEAMDPRDQIGVSMENIQKRDIWSFGCMFFHLLTNKYPFEKPLDTLGEFRLRLLLGERSQINPHLFAPKSHAIIEKLLVALSFRPSANELLNLIRSYTKTGYK